MKNSQKANKPALRLIAAGLCLLMLAPGCSRGRPSDAESQDTPAPSASPAVTDEPRQGGTLRLAMPVNAPSSDPLQVTTEEMLNLFSLVYDTLLTVSPSGELEPCLCESWSSEGPGVWLLKLREGVKWHDGKELWSGDVVNTYEALCELEESYYKPCLDHIISIETETTKSLRVRLDTVGIMGLYSLTFPIRKNKALVGTGAYRLDSITDEQIVLKVNEHWWNKRPYIDRVVFSERDSNSTALASYEAGQLNMAPTDVLTAGKYSKAGETNVLDVMTQDMEALLFNSGSRVFSERNVRLAVAHGINRSRIITNVYSNRARAADVPIPPDSWLYDSRSAILNYDAQAAASLLNEAGYTVFSSDGTTLRKPAGSELAVRLLTSATTENTVRSEAAALIASQLAELGFKVEVVTAAHSLGDPESEFVNALKAGDWDMALVGFNLSLGSDLSSYVDPGGANNYGAVNDPELSRSVLNMNVADSEESLREAAYGFQSYFVENVPFLTLYFRLNSIIFSADIEGVFGAREPLLFADEKNWYFR